MAAGFTKCIKMFLFVANAVVLVLGLILFGFGIRTLVDTSSKEKVLGGDVSTAGWLMVGLGLIVAVFSFFGSVGACTHSKCFLFLYFIALLIVFIAILAVGAAAYANRSSLDRQMNSAMYDSTKYYGNNSALREAWDAIQKEFKCCGVVKMNDPKDPVREMSKEKGYTVWASNPEFQKNGPKVPASCCKNPGNDYEKSLCINLNVDKINTADCYAALKDIVKSNAVCIGGVVLGIELVLVLGISLSLALLCMKRN